MADWHKKEVGNHVYHRYTIDSLASDPGGIEAAKAIEQFAQTLHDDEARVLEWPPVVVGRTILLRSVALSD